MSCRAFACDYDGTLAHLGKVGSSTFDALLRIRAARRKLILVTGRELEELFAVFPEAGIFDILVVENGAVLYFPSTQTEEALGRAPSADAARALREAGITPISFGRRVIATARVNEPKVISVLGKMKDRFDFVYNKGSLMLLPPGVDKGSGVRAAMKKLNVSPENTVAIGDAQNDRELLLSCGSRVAVANALPEIKKIAHLVTDASEGDGVIEVIEGLLSSDSVAA